MVQGIELQIKLRARLKQTATGEAIMFGFALGPIQIFVIAGLPQGEELNPLVYIKLSLKPAAEWEMFKDHTQQNRLPRKEREQD